LTESAVPILPSRDLGETLAFLERLGWKETGASYQVWDYLIVSRGAIELHFFSHPAVDPRTTDAMCYLRVEDADALYKKTSGARSASSTTLRPGHVW
jgi:hypothetical protein